MEKIIEKILDELGMNISYLGYFYYKKAVEIVINDSNRIGYAYKITNIYTTIAKKYKTSPLRVERAMRYAKDSLENLSEKLSVSYKIDNTTLLALLVRKTLEELENESTKV